MRDRVNTVLLGYTDLNQLLHTHVDLFCWDFLIHS